VDIGLLVGGVDLGSLLVDGRKKGGQDLQLQALYEKAIAVNDPLAIAAFTLSKNLLARLFSSSIFPFKWLEVVQASVKVIPLALSAYLVSRSPMMTPDLLSRRPLTLKVYIFITMRTLSETILVRKIVLYANLQHRWGQWS
jgi:hypothetical protein